MQFQIRDHAKILPSCTCHCLTLASLNTEIKLLLLSVLIFLSLRVFPSPPPFSKHIFKLLFNLGLDKENIREIYPQATPGDHVS